MGMTFHIGAPAALPIGGSPSADEPFGIATVPAVVRRIRRPGLTGPLDREVDDDRR
jgi:hypothetical protein